MATPYSIAIERGDLNYDELEPNYRKHYKEMCDRLEREGISSSEYNPRLPLYFQAFSEGWLINYVVRIDGKAIGHSNVWLTNNMHNGDLIAREDTIYVLPEHRNGIGKKLVKFILADLKLRKVRHVFIEPVTDLRVAKIWRRMGFKDVAQKMIYEFER